MCGAKHYAEFAMRLRESLRTAHPVSSTPGSAQPQMSNLRSRIFDIGFEWHLSPIQKWLASVVCLGTRPTADATICVEQSFRISARRRGTFDPRLALDCAS